MAGVKTVVLFFEKGCPMKRTWFYQLHLDRTFGKMSPLNEDDLVEFRKLFKKKADSANSCTVNIYTAHFQAIGNTALLRWPLILPVQCSRRDFAYKRERLVTGSWKILRDASGEPIVEYASRSFSLEKAREK
jgi:hypothetical protein